jgi:hypothetical protein
MPTATTLREALTLMGLDADAVDLDWIARIMAQTEDTIAALRSEPGFASEEPLFKPEQQPGHSGGG